MNHMADSDRLKSYEAAVAAVADERALVCSRHPERPAEMLCPECEPLFSIGDFTVSESIAFWAHVAGFAAGAAAGTLLYRQKTGALRERELNDRQASTEAWNEFLAAPDGRRALSAACPPDENGALARPIPLRPGTYLTDPLSLAGTGKGSERFLHGKRRAQLFVPRKTGPGSLPLRLFLQQLRDFIHRQTDSQTFPMPPRVRAFLPDGEFRAW